MAYHNSPYLRKLRKLIAAEALGILMMTLIITGQTRTILTGGAAGQPLGNDNLIIETIDGGEGAKKDYIKWVDFTVSYEALCKAYEWDVETHGSENELNWIELLAYAAARTGGVFEKDALTRIDNAAKEISSGGTTMEELTADLQYYPYYLEAYTAAIGGLVGEYQ